MSRYKFSWVVLILLLTGFVVLLPSLSILATADTIELYPAADTFIVSNQPDTNFGSNTGLMVGELSNTGLLHARIRFSGIPAGASIQSATLRLYRTMGSGSHTLAVQSASRSWQESTLTWNADGSTNRWATPKSTYGMSIQTGYVSVDVTSHVQEWADGYRSNYGFHLSTDGTIGENHTFASRESATSSYRPKLEIVYSPVTADNAEIVWFNPPTGTLQRGNQASATVCVRNTGTSTRRFWVGLSFGHESTTLSDWPRGWYDIRPIESATLAPGNEQTITFSFRIRETLREGNYNARTAIWDDYDSNRHLMLPIGSPYDAEDHNSAFYLPSRQILENSFLDHLREIIWDMAQDQFVGGDIEEMYHGNIGGTSEKALFYLGCKSAHNFYNHVVGSVAVEMGGKIVIDLADLCDVTAEGKDDGYVTVCIDADGAAGIGIASDTFQGMIQSDIGFMVHEFEYDELCLADDRSNFTSALEGALFGYAFTMASWSTNEGWNGWRFERTTAFDIQGISLGVDANSLYTFEINKNDLFQAMKAVFESSSAQDFDEIATNLENAIMQLVSSVRDTTFDDGSWEVFDGELRSDLKCTVNGEAHHFFINVPPGAAELSIDMYGGTGDADLYVRYGQRPTTTEYDERPYLTGNDESVQISNPPSGNYYFMIRAYSAYDGVSAVARISGLQPPDSPSGINAQIGSGAGQIALSWNAVSKATGYKIYYDEDSSNPPFSPSDNGTPVSGSDVGNVTQVTISDLTLGGSYYCAVVAYNSAGDSDYSSQDSATAGDNPSSPPVPATDPSPINGAIGQSIDTDMSWSNGGGATSYNVYFGTDSTPDSGEYKGNQTSTTYDPGTLNYNTTY